MLRRHLNKSLILFCLLAISGFSVGCSEDSGPKDMPRETTPDPQDTTLLDVAPLSLFG